MYHMFKEIVTYNLSAVGLRPSMVPVPVYAASKHAVVGFIRAWGVSKLRHKLFIFFQYPKRESPDPQQREKPCSISGNNVFFFSFLIYGQEIGDSLKKY